MSGDNASIRSTSGVLRIRKRLATSAYTKGCQTVFSMANTFLAQLPLIMFYISSKLNYFRKPNIQYRFFMKVSNWTWSRTTQVVIHFKCLHVSNMHQNEIFQIWFFKTFLGRGSPSPSLDPALRFFLCPRFRLRPQFSYASRFWLGFCPWFSGASRPWSGLASPSTFDWSTWIPPYKFRERQRLAKEIKPTYR